VLDREEILRRFEAWLDRALVEEAPPNGMSSEILAALQGEDPPPGVDQYALWSAVVALTQEVKLQGRSFKQLSETLAPVEQLVPRADQALAAFAQLVRDSRQEAARQAQDEVLEALLDLRDRLARGLQLAAAGLARPATASASGWLQRWRSRLAAQSDRESESQAALAVEAMRQGYELCLERLDELLAEYHVQPIACQGRMFDPSCMKVVDTAVVAESPEGAVLEVYRNGYERDGEVYRYAEVKVARTRQPLAASAAAPAALPGRRDDDE
jgi:molecular chaperone GrpE